MDGTSRSKAMVRNHLTMTLGHLLLETNGCRS